MRNTLHILMSTFPWDINQRLVFLIAVGSVAMFLRLHSCMLISFVSSFRYTCRSGAATTNLSERNSIRNTGYSRGLGFRTRGSNRADRQQISCWPTYHQDDRSFASDRRRSKSIKRQDQHPEDPRTNPCQRRSSTSSFCTPVSDDFCEGFVGSLSTSPCGSNCSSRSPDATVNSC